MTTRKSVILSSTIGYALLTTPRRLTAAGGKTTAHGRKTRFAAWSAARYERSCRLGGNGNSSLTRRHEEAKRDGTANGKVHTEARRTRRTATEKYAMRTGARAACPPVVGKRCYAAGCRVTKGRAALVETTTAVSREGDCDGGSLCGKHMRRLLNPSS
jgi:hypothetical protein